MRCDRSRKQYGGRRRPAGLFIVGRLPLGLRESVRRSSGAVSFHHENIKMIFVMAGEREVLPSETTLATHCTSRERSGVSHPYRQHSWWKSSVAPKRSEEKAMDLPSAETLVPHSWSGCVPLRRGFLLFFFFAFNPF